MTKLQKKILECLFRGGHIIPQLPGQTTPGQMTLFNEKVKITATPGKWTVREKNFKLVARASNKKVQPLFEYCRIVNIGKVPAYIINKSLILSLHGNTWMKRQYKEIRDQKKRCLPSTFQLIISNYKTDRQ